MQRKNLAPEAVALRIGVGMIVTHLHVDPINLRLRLCDSCPGFQAADDRESARVTSLHLRVREGERLPDVGTFPELTTGAEIEKLQWKIEAFRHDAHNGEGTAVHYDLRIHGVRISVESPLPEALADYDDVVASILCFFRIENPPLDRVDAE